MFSLAVLFSFMLGTSLATAQCDMTLTLGAPKQQIIFKGKTTFRKGIRSVGFLMKLTGFGINMEGEEGHSIECGGKLYWDGKGEQGEKKPRFFRVQNVKDSHISSLNVFNMPQHGFSINGCHDVTFDKITINNTAGDKSAHNPQNFGKNTDGFGVSSSSKITISNALVHNQDDCLALNSGTGITFIGGTCIGSHGISIGSVRNGDVVSGVRVSNSVIKDAQNAIRIKTYATHTGSVTDVSYKNITLQGTIDKAIVVVQDYINHGKPAAPGDSRIEDFTVSNVRMVGAKVAVAVAVEVNCGKNCKKWNWSNIEVKGKKNCIHGAPEAIRSFC